MHTTARTARQAISKMAYIPKMVTIPINRDDTNDHTGKFANRYRVQSIEVEQPARDYAYYSTSLQQYEYQNPYNSTVVVKMDMGYFKELVRNDQYAEDENYQRRHEAYMRDKHAALRDAWDKYKMLLALLEH